MEITSHASCHSNGSAAVQVLLFVYMGLKSFASQMALTSSMVILNLTAPEGTLGAVNGVGQTLASLARSIGPAMCGTAWSIAVRFDFPGHQCLPFVFLAGGSLLTYYLCTFLKIPMDSLY